MTKWINAKTINNYFGIVQDDLRAIRHALKGTPHIKQSKSRCSAHPGKFYLWYDLEHLIKNMGIAPKMQIPDRLIFIE